MKSNGMGHTSVTGYTFRVKLAYFQTRNLSSFSIQKHYLIFDNKKNEKKNLNKTNPSHRKSGNAYKYRASIMLFCLSVPNYLLHFFLKLEQIFTSVLFQQSKSLRIVSDIDRLNIV